MDVATMLDTFVSYGYETDDEMTDERKLEALNDTYQDICVREFWPWTQDWIVGLINTDGALIVNPTSQATWIAAGNTIRAISGVVIEAAQSPSGSRVILQPMRPDDFFRTGDTLYFDGNSPGVPQVYYRLNGLAWWAAPTPPNDTICNILAYWRPGDLTTETPEDWIAVPKRFHRSALVMGTLAKLALMQDDPEMSASFEQQYEKTLAIMRNEFIEQTDRTDYIHVYDTDNWDYS